MRSLWLCFWNHIDPKIFQLSYLQSSSLICISNLLYWTLYEKFIVYSFESHYKQGQHIGGSGLSHLITIVDGKVINESIFIVWSFLSHCHSQLKFTFFIVKFLHAQTSIWYSLGVVFLFSICLEKKLAVL